MLCSYADLIKSEIYSDLLQPKQLVHQACAIIEKTESVTAGLSVIRGARNGSFGEDVLKVLRFLAPHVRRALVVHDRFLSLKAHANAQSAALNSVQPGFVLVCRQGRVIYANRAAEDVAAANDGLILKSSGLSAELPDEDRKLAALLQSVASSSMERRGGCMKITRRNARPLVVVVSPCSGENEVYSEIVGRTRPAGAVFITDPDAKRFAPADLLRSVYGLTRCEARLAVKLTAGESLIDAAQQLNVTYGTVRSQLKIIFQKTNTSRQSELIRVLSLLPSPATNPRA
jgi:DNA-binding CsgD family transcriptional regulator/PAS domain-containing protein